MKKKVIASVVAFFAALALVVGVSTTANANTGYKDTQYTITYAGVGVSTIVVQESAWRDSALHAHGSVSVSVTKGWGLKSVTVGTGSFAYSGQAYWQKNSTGYFTYTSTGAHAGSDVFYPGTITVSTKSGILTATKSIALPGVSFS